MTAKALKEPSLLVLAAIDAQFRVMSITQPAFIGSRPPPDRQRGAGVLSLGVALAPCLPTGAAGKGNVSGRNCLSRSMAVTFVAALIPAAATR